jgi:hypothetical protein
MELLASMEPADGNYDLDDKAAALEEWADAQKEEIHDVIFHDELQWLFDNTG